MKFQYEPGYQGAFTRDQAEGAITNGSMVVKVKRETGDSHRIGDRATILGSIREPYKPGRIMYFIEWESEPHVAVACIGWKLEQA
jgi:hypothetical protein